MKRLLALAWLLNGPGAARLTKSLISREPFRFTLKFGSSSDAEVIRVSATVQELMVIEDSNTSLWATFHLTRESCQKHFKGLDVVEVSGHYNLARREGNMDVSTPDKKES